MYINEYKIARDNENVVVHKVGKNQKTGEETLSATGYVRDFLGGLQLVARRMGVSATEAKDLAAAIDLIKEQHEEIITLVKKNCKACLK